MLQVQSISKQFGGLLALNNVSFEIQEGEVVGLIGPNGSGKSTAFNVITGNLPASSGSIIFEGEDITDLPAHQVARLGIARTFRAYGRDVGKVVEIEFLYSMVSGIANVQIYPI